MFRDHLTHAKTEVNIMPSNIYFHQTSFLSCHQFWICEQKCYSGNPYLTPEAKSVFQVLTKFCGTKSLLNGRFLVRCYLFHTTVQYLISEKVISAINCVQRHTQNSHDMRPFRNLWTLQNFKDWWKLKIHSTVFSNEDTVKEK